MNFSANRTGQFQSTLRI